MHPFFSAPWQIFAVPVLVFICSEQLFAQGLGFDAALRAAAERAPTLQARMASVQGSRALQTSAAELPDPKLSVGIDSLPINGPDRGSLTRDNFTQRQIGWTQDVPNKAKRSARTDAALARTERDQALLQTERLCGRHPTCVPCQTPRRGNRQLPSRRPCRTGRNRRISTPPHDRG